MIQWIPERSIRDAHDRLIEKYGGSYGILDENVFLSIMDKPKNLLCYGEDVTIFSLAASYGYGFAKSQCFVDGNKRTSLAAISAFLILNGYRLTASESEAAAFILDIASSNETQDEGMERLSQWITNNSKES